MRISMCSIVFDLLISLGYMMIFKKSCQNWQDLIIQLNMKVKHIIQVEIMIVIKKGRKVTILKKIMLGGGLKTFSNLV